MHIQLFNNVQFWPRNYDNFIWRGGHDSLIGDARLYFDWLPGILIMSAEAPCKVTYFPSKIGKNVIIGKISKTVHTYFTAIFWLFYLLTWQGHVHRFIGHENDFSEKNCLIEF